MANISNSTVRAEFPPAAASVADARRFVVRTIAGWDVADLDDAALLTSELATNAVIHAQTPYAVTIERRTDRVRVGIDDGSVVTARRCRYSPTSGTGRGLGMVDDVAAAWGVEATATGKCVWFELPFPRS